VTTSGLVVVDKPAGWTSHDVVARLRRLAHTRRVGHAGTLDPMATGVLVVGVEKATRLLRYLALADKGYTGTIRLGQATTTDDAEGDLISRARVSGVTTERLAAATDALTGALQQVPSAVSAIKIMGKRSYARVRAGEDVVLAPRPVQVTRFEPTAMRPVTGDLLDVDVVVECSSGTYVRALARDLGARLGVGGHLTALRRTRVGPFGIAQAATLDELAQRADPVTLPLPDAVRAAMPVRSVSAEQARELAFGRWIPPIGQSGTYAACAAADGSVIALLEETPEKARPVLVFASAG
jgi:tRNA pseudouridine55 synthase